MRVAWHSQGMEGVPPDGSWLSSREAEWAHRMRFEKRRSEFLLGRWTAKQAIALYLQRPATAEGLASIVIDRAPGGAPAPLLDGQPAPVSVSMTDRADQAVCVVGPPGMGLGVDLELVESRSPAFLADFLTESERAVVTAASGPEEHGVLANLIWCGKESALKVLRTGLRRDTRSVEVSFPEEPSMDGWAAMRVRAVEGAEFPGWWKRFGAFVLTVAASAPFEPPRALVEPPGLVGAVPAHRWMKRPPHGGPR